MPKITSHLNIFGNASQEYIDSVIKEVHLIREGEATKALLKVFTEKELLFMLGIYNYGIAIRNKIKKSGIKLPAEFKQFNHCLTSMSKNGWLTSDSVSNLQENLKSELIHSSMGIQYINFAIFEKLTKTKGSPLKIEQRYLILMLKFCLTHRIVKKPRLLTEFKKTHDDAIADFLSEQGIVDGTTASNIKRNYNSSFQQLEKIFETRSLMELLAVPETREQDYYKYVEQKAKKVSIGMMKSNPVQLIINYHNKLDEVLKSIKP